MGAHQGFYRQQNEWWREAARQMMATGLDGRRRADEWAEANRRLWCLSLKAEPDRQVLRAHDRADLVQAMLLRLLQCPELLTRLSDMDAPAQYLEEMMLNMLRNQGRRSRQARRTAPRYAKAAQAWESERPDYQAIRKETNAAVRYIVYHELRREDREVLLLRYYQGMSVAAISAQLGISEAAALQRLFRARKRFEEAYED